jgi:hypothetical protein
MAAKVRLAAVRQPMPVALPLHAPLVVRAQGVVRLHATRPWHILVPAGHPLMRG